MKTITIIGAEDYQKSDALVFGSYDLITEESWVIVQEMAKTGKPFNYKTFKSLCDKKSKSIFLEVLTGDISVAHQNV